MLNLLIANHNLQNLHDLLNYISLYVPDVRISYLAQDGREALDALNGHHYDFAILEYRLPNFDGLDILDKLSSPKQIEYANSIIFLSHNLTLVKNIKSHRMIFDSFSTSSSFSIIIQSLKRLVENKKNNNVKDSHIKSKIITELQNIGYNLAHHGTQYIAETVWLIVTEHYDSENLSKNVYPIVSKTYRKSLNNVKTNITVATDAAYKNMDKFILKKYLGLPDTIKPTAKMVINTVVRKILEE